MEKVIHIGKIKWDVDNKSDLKHLPKELTAKFNDVVKDPNILDEDLIDINDCVADYLSNVYGYCVNKFYFTIEK